MKIKELTLIPILGTIIFLTSLIKIPSIFPGAEFQMSAPISVLISMTFGPKIYILAGLIGSFLSFFTGISNIYGIIVALVFRIGVLVFILLIKNKNFCLLFASSFGTSLSRIVLSKLLGLPLISLLIPALPGMIISGVLAKLFYEKIYGRLLTYNILEERIWSTALRWEHLKIITKRTYILVGLKV